MQAWQAGRVISPAVWKRVVQPLLPGPQSWAFKGKLAYRTPVDWVVLGLLAEGSGFRRDHVYVTVLWTPLFVPRDSLTLDHSRRVPNGSTPVAEDRLDATVRLALSHLPTQAEALHRIAGSRSEEAAYAALLLGSAHDAQRRLVEPYWPDDDRPFVSDARERRSVLSAALDRDASEGLEILRAWRDQTAAALDID